MKEDLYNVPAFAGLDCHRTELTVKKSRFITSVFHVSSGDEAKAAIEHVCREFSDARHNCFAYNAGKPGSTAVCGCSDDGEPHGTAGRPMLNVVLHSDVGELCVVVTRYFGGILLGTGGLVKAYQDSVKLALEDLPLTVRIIPAFITVCFEQRYITVFLRLLPNFRAEIIDSNFADKAFYHVRLPQSEVENFRQKLIEMTKGQVDFAEVKN